MAFRWRLRFPLYAQVLLGVVAGIAIGVLRPDWGLQAKPLGDLFIRLVKVLIGPIVFTTVAAGIAGMGDLKRVGRVGLKALLWFEAMTSVALVLGLAMVSWVKPGARMHARLDTLDTLALGRALPAGAVHADGLSSVIPETFFGAFAQGNVLQILVLALLVGWALATLGPKAERILKGMEAISTVLFASVGVVMRLAPIGAFGGMAYAVAKHGVGTLGNLARLMAAFYGTSLLFVFGVLGTALALLCGLSIFQLVRYLREELVLVLGTSSSESALPALMDKMERLGCQPAVVRLVVPTGYSFNLDGTCIYLTMGAVFVAQALDVPLSLGDQLQLLLVLLLTSKGAAGVTGSGLVTLSATLSATGASGVSVPQGGLTLLLGIDRFMSEARALTNFMGNAVATLVVARWERALDVGVARAVLRDRMSSEVSKTDP